MLPILSYTCLGTAIIVLPLGLFGYYKLWRGSQSKFAYLVMAFTVGLGLQCTGTFVTLMLPTEYIKPALPNLYALTICIFFFFLLSLQTWIYGMQYLNSAIVCSKTIPILSENNVRSLKLAITISYTLCMIILCGFIMGTIANSIKYGSINFKEWLNSSKVRTIFFYSRAIWLGLNLVATIFTVFSVKMILANIKELQLTNPNFQSNSKTMMLHCLMLVLHTIVQAINSLPTEWFNQKQWEFIVATLVVLSLVQQLQISFICLTIGNQPSLRNF